MSSAFLTVPHLLRVTLRLEGSSDSADDEKHSSSDRGVRGPTVLLSLRRGGSSAGSRVSVPVPLDRGRVGSVAAVVRLAPVLGRVLDLDALLLTRSADVLEPRRHVRVAVVVVAVQAHLDGLLEVGSAQAVGVVPVGGLADLLRLLVRTAQLALRELVCRLTGESARMDARTYARTAVAAVRATSVNFISDWFA